VFVGLIVAVYANSLPNGFHYDDVSSILQNPAVQHIDRVPEHFWSVTIGKQEGGVSYRPLVMVSYGLNYWWGATNPVGYHVVNIALHVLASLLVVLLGWNLSGHSAAAVLGGLVFALHPIHTEAVNYMTARSSMLYGAAALAVVVGFIRFRATGRMALLVASLAAYVASLLAKEAAVIVPLLLIGYDVIVRRSEWSAARRWGAPHVAFVVLTLGYIAVRRAMMGELAPPAYHADPMIVGLTFAAVVAKTLTGQLMPSNLSIAHPFGPMRDLTLQALGALTVVAGLAAIWATARRRAPVLAYAAMWFPVALLPVGVLTLITPLALYQENRGYLSAAALAFATGPLLAWCWEARGTGNQWVQLRRATLLALFGAMAITVVSRNPVWRDDVSLWRDALNKAPGNQTAYVNLGAAYQARGDWANAAQVYQQALERFPNNGMLHNNLGAVYRSAGDTARAAEAFRTAIRINPGLAMPYFNLGLTLQDAGATGEAVAAYRRFLELAPGQAGTALNMERARQRLADLESGGVPAIPPSAGP
jgi:predicted TPR repeat methyltransferase